MSLDRRTQLGGGLPPGVVPNYIDPPNNAHYVPIVASILLVLAGVVVLIDIAFSRVRKWAVDKILLTVALVFAIAHVTIANIEILQWGMGRHIWDLPLPPKPNMDMAYRYENLNQMMYDVSMMFTKLSILTFYLAIFGIQRNFRYATYFMMAFVTSYLTAFLFVNIFQCTPEKKVWYPITVEGVCLDGFKTQTSLGVLNIVTDTIILIMPFPSILRLNMNKTRMASIAAVFAVGLFTVAASITRTVVVATTIAVSTDADQTWAIGPQINWLSIELLTGLLCAGLISLPQAATFFANETKLGQSLKSLLSRSRTGESSAKTSAQRDTSPSSAGAKSQRDYYELDDAEHLRKSEAQDSHVGDWRL